MTIMCKEHGKVHVCTCVYMWCHCMYTQVFGERWLGVSIHSAFWSKQKAIFLSEAWHSLCARILIKRIEKKVGCEAWHSWVAWMRMSVPQSRIVLKLPRTVGTSSCAQLLCIASYHAWPKLDFNHQVVQNGQETRKNVVFYRVYGFCW